MEDAGARDVRRCRRGGGDTYPGSVGCGHGPSPFHPPDGEGVAEPLVGQVVAAGDLVVQLIALQDLVQEVYVAGGQLEGLDLAQLVGGQRRDDLPQLREGVVERLGPLAFPHVGDHALRVHVLEGLRDGAALAPLALRRGRAAILRRLAPLAALAEAFLVQPLAFLLASDQAAFGGIRAHAFLFHLLGTLRAKGSGGSHEMRQPQRIGKEAWRGAGARSRGTAWSIHPSASPNFLSLAEPSKELGWFFLWATERRAFG